MIVLTYIYLNYLASKIVLYKNSTGFEQDVCIDCLLWQKKYYEVGK